MALFTISNLIETRAIDVAKFSTNTLVHFICTLANDWDTGAYDGSAWTVTHPIEDLDHDVAVTSRDGNARVAGTIVTSNGSTTLSTVGILCRHWEPLYKIDAASAGLIEASQVLAALIALTGGTIEGPSIADAGGVPTVYRGAQVSIWGREPLEPRKVTWAGSTISSELALDAASSALRLELPHGFIGSSVSILEQTPAGDYAPVYSAGSLVEASVLAANRAINVLSPLGDLAGLGAYALFPLGQLAGLASVKFASDQTETCTARVRGAA